MWFLLNNCVFDQTILFLSNKHHYYDKYDEYGIKKVDLYKLDFYVVLKFKYKNTNSIILLLKLSCHKSALLLLILVYLTPNLALKY